MEEIIEEIRTNEIFVELNEEELEGEERGGKENV